MKKESTGHAARRADDIDAHVGRRIRARRMMLGMSQSELADRLGITFQQVQKYEKGTNRVSASKLQQTADVLDLPIQFFFRDDTSTGDKDFEVALLQDRDAATLLRAFARIKSDHLRRAVVAHIQALADGDEENSTD